MFKANYKNYIEIYQSKDGVCMKGNNLYKALFDVYVLYNLFKIMLSVMFITLALVAFIEIGLCC